MSTRRHCWILAVIAVALAGCTDTLRPPAEEPFPAVPAHMPAVPFPADNPITRSKAELGRHLFYEMRLSSDNTVACGTCHRQENAFTDSPNQVSVGVDGARGQRNAPPLLNVAYQNVFFWDGRAGTLEEQAMAAFMNPAEMNADTVKAAELMRSGDYRRMWKDAWGDTVITMRRLIQAITTFERTIVGADSPYDRYIRGDRNALNAQEQEGMRLFFSERTQCGACHGGVNFTDNQYHNVGLFHHYFDVGRYNVTRKPADEGRFKTPTLRNIELTPPYMATGDSEQGDLRTLEQVMDHYDRGGTNFVNKDKRVRKLSLTDAEKAAMVAFMKALTDRSLLTDPRFAKP
ncbi:MAG: c-type cytochrome ['Candidatus Kapabacteria' thiocyanatum]|mgnify:CR=1 FL=1|uniref:Methylamine utilization protein MauG n=1 Tax=Candidatus Kapaibacterium thiocyanatum TaxID=1895771 RepID=A0A1M3KXM0_9BACT|nr:c-type cytochrome ['Candidatus Kapabacteria' thiocyanatum]OJX57004.1 MAG: hypothetical protein BGO89_10830 ['Candidatus Kapabacteria' thiocyanatum]